MCLFWKVTCNFLCQIILNNFFGKHLQHCAGVCDLFSGQMMAVSAEIGAENKTTCLETRKSGVSSLKPRRTALPFVKRAGKNKKDGRYWKKHELCSQTVFCNLFSTQPLVCKWMPVFFLFSCGTLVWACPWSSARLSECPEACWGGQVCPWRDAGDPSPTSDCWPCSANRITTSLSSKQGKLV